MAFETRKVVDFPLGYTYRGPTAIVQVEFPFVFSPIPDALSQLDLMTQGVMLAASIDPAVKDNYLQYILESDTEPTIDRYRITIVIAGETEEASGSPAMIEGPQAWIAPVLIGALILGFAVLVGAVVWMITSGRWGAATVGFGILLPVALGIGGVWLLAQGLSKKGII